MRVRDAVEADAGALASMTGRPRGVVRDMIHDRSVRVAMGGETGRGDEGTPADEETPGANDEPEETPVEAVAGFIAFDVRDGTVHVTTFEGESNAVSRLFSEPIRFAAREGMAVETVVPTAGDAPGIVEAVGFEPVGPGPRIDGTPTTRYGFDPDED